MNQEAQKQGSKEPQEQEGKETAQGTRPRGAWALSAVWGAGAAIFGWLLAGVIYGRDYPNLTWGNLGWDDWGMALLAGLGVGGLSYGIFWYGSKSKKTVQENRAGALIPIIVALLPALFLVLALATLVLTLATYSPEWKDARQGLATAFASLIAAVGVVVSVAVSYKSGEENRKAQKEIEDEKGEREERKQDAELIKTLNDRLHEIIPRRYGDEKRVVLASYLQLAALYKDWEILAGSSKLVEKQKKSQQRSIFEILWGFVHDKENVRSEEENRILNSIIQEIIPEFQGGYEKFVDVREGGSGV